MSVAFLPDSFIDADVTPSPNHDERKGGRRPDLILLHYTGMQSGEAALDRLCSAESKVSSHYVVFEDGRIVQCVPEERRAWHAGMSFWAGEEDINLCSIGIEIVNPGHEFGYSDFPLRQIHAHNYLFVNARVARAAGIADGGWMWVESPWGRVRCLCRHSEAVEPGTVWTWNAIGKVPGAWGLAPDAAEARQGFLLNHLITDELPGRTSNSDPITGQAGWYDVRVRIYKAEPGEPEESWPRFEAVPAAPGTGHAPERQAYFAGTGEWK